MRTFVVRRDIAGVGRFDQQQLGDAAKVANEAMARLAPDVQWVHSFVTGDATFCTYLARDEEDVRRHAELSGFPASSIHEVRGMFDPTTGSARRSAARGSR